MIYAVLGTGSVGRTVAAKLADLGHPTVIGTRDPSATLASEQTDSNGGPPFRVWAEAHPSIALATFAEAAADAEVVVNATHGAASLAALEAAGEENLAGKVLIDIANPLDFSRGMPPSLLVSDVDSLGEQIQRRFPRARVVKALNTMSAPLMVDPGQLGGGDHTAFVSGDDADAKAQVMDLLTSFGHRDVIDLGDIATARGTEMYLPLWLRLWGAIGTPIFNVKVVR